MIKDDINAKTKLFAVLGYPIAHSLSPFIQNTAAKMRGCDMVYTAMRVTPEELENAVKGGKALGISGFNITVPHKKNVMQYLCGIDPQAEMIGAVNTLKLTENGYVGYNTDIIGVYYALKENGVEVKGKNVLVTGAGGAGNACAAMAVVRGAKNVYIANRTEETAEKLAERFKPAASENGCMVRSMGMYDIYGLENVDIVINTTVLGFGDKADLTPIEDAGWYKRAGVSTVFDAVYSPWETRLLREAKKQGVKTINGFPMLVYQALAAQEIWFDEEFSPEFRREVCEKVTAYYKTKQ